MSRLDTCEMTDEAIADRAVELYADDDINIDSDAKVSRGEGGAWVQAWVWVGDD